MTEPARIGLEQLTLEKLGQAKFSRTMHLNGGSKFSQLTYHCAQWNLNELRHTDGRPNYKITARELQHAGGDAVADLTPPLTADAQKERLQKFCDDYNAERDPATTQEKAT